VIPILTSIPIAICCGRKLSALNECLTHSLTHSLS